MYYSCMVATIFQSNVCQYNFRLCQINESAVHRTAGAAVWCHDPTGGNTWHFLSFFVLLVHLYMLSVVDIGPVMDQDIVWK